MKLTKSLFLKPILKGNRFDDHSIPVEVFSEFNSYKNLILEVAKHLYKKKNSKQRLPGGFGDQLTLKISQIQQGSAIALLEREYDSTSDYVEFEEARDLVDAVIAQKGQITNFPENLYYLFDSFGKTLVDGEEFLLCKPNQLSTDATIYSKQVRGQLLSINRKPFLGSINVSGRITDVNLVNGRFEMQTHNGITISGQYTEEFKQTLRDAHTNYESTSAFSVGSAFISPDNSVSRIEKLQHLVCISDDDKISSIPAFEQTLDAMKQLKQGWFDGQDGLPIDPALIENVKKLLFDFFQTHSIVFPYLYPTTDGGVRAEWSWGKWEVSTEFVHNQKQSEVFATQINGSQVRECKVSWADTQSIKEFADFLCELSSLNL